jgi:hypothetical protein
MKFKLAAVILLTIISTGCLASKNKAVLKAQTVTDLRGCTKIGRIEFSGGQIFAVVMLGHVAADGAARSTCEDMEGNVILSEELCYYCSDLDTEY